MKQRKSREEHGVQAKDRIMIRGESTFARLDKPIDGQELVDENNRRAQRGQKPSNSPFRVITIKNPSIVEGHNTPLANYYAERIYPSKDGTAQLLQIESKSQFPPAYAHYTDEQGNAVEIADPMKNPEKGQVLDLCIEAFGGKGGTNMSSSFNGIIFAPGPIKFYEGAGSSIQGFGMQFGINVTPMSAEQKAAADAAKAASQQQQLVGAGTGAQQGFAQQQPQGGFAQQTQSQPQGGFVQPNPAEVAQQQGFAQQRPQGGFAEQNQSQPQGGFGQPQGFQPSPQESQPIGDQAGFSPSGQVAGAGQTPFGAPGANNVTTQKNSSPFG